MAKYYENIQHLEKMHGPAMPKEVSKVPELLVNHGIALGRSISAAYAENYKQDAEHAAKMATSLDDLQKRTDASEYKKGAQFMAPFASRNIDKRAMQMYELKQHQQNVAMQNFFAREKYREGRAEIKQKIKDDNALATKFLSKAEDLITKVPGAGLDAFNNYKKQFGIIYEQAASGMNVVTDSFKKRAELQLKYAETLFKHGDNTKKLTDFDRDQIANDMEKDFQDIYPDWRTNPERIDDIVGFIRELDNNLPRAKTKERARAMISSLNLKKGTEDSKLKQLLASLPGFFTDKDIASILSNIDANAKSFTISAEQEAEIYEKQLANNFHRRGQPSFTERKLSPERQSTEDYLIENPINGKSPDDLRVEAGQNPKHANALNEIAAAIETDFNSDFIAAAKKWGFSDVHTDIILTPPTTEGEGLDKFAIAWRARLSDFDYVVRNKFNNAQTLNSAYSATERPALSRTYKTMLPEQRTALFNTMVDGVMAVDTGFINLSTYAEMIGNGLGDGYAASFARLKMAGIEDGSFYKFQDAMLSDMQKVFAVNADIHRAIFNVGGAEDIDQNILLDLSRKATAELWQTPEKERRDYEQMELSYSHITFAQNVRDKYAYIQKGLSRTAYVTAGKDKSDSLNKMMSETLVMDPFEFDISAEKVMTIGELCSKRPCRIVNNDANSFYFMVAKNRNDARGGKYEFLMADDYNNALILRP